MTVENRGGARKRFETLQEKNLEHPEEFGAP